MIRLFLALCSLALADLAAAQVAVVRSGAHDGFDRLVVDMPVRMEWYSELSDDGASVVFEDKSLQFDLDAAFARIGRARLRAIHAPDGGGQLDLDFACACRLRAFWHGASMLVLDIVGGEPIAIGSSTRPESRAMRGTERVSETVTSTRHRSPASLALAESMRGRVGPRKIAIPNEWSTAATKPGLNAMNETLLTQLSRAASQGLITLPALTRSTVLPATTSESGEMRIVESTETYALPERATQSDPPTFSAPQPSFRATTSMDRDVRRATHSKPNLESSDSCPSRDFIDVRSWGGARPYRSEIGSLNGTLFGEFDRIDKANALRLARLYIHHGFSAEARQILALLEPSAPEIIIARELADIVEHVPYPGGILANALNCEEPVVLWALLAMSDLPEDRVFDHRALKRSFVALPKTLRRSLGPVLVRRLVSAGHDKTAEAIFRLIGRDKISLGPGSELAKVALAGRAGGQAEADGALRELVRSNAAQSGEALAESIERALRQDQPVTLADAQLAGALAFEHRGTPVGNRLAAAYLGALGASGAFEPAVREFDRLRPTLVDETASKLAALLVEDLVHEADDVTFLRHVMTDRLAPSRSLPEPLALAVANRLLDLGFAGHALRYVESHSLGDENRNASLLRARIALAQGHAAKAELELLGLDGLDADILRAEALVSLGRHAAARRFFASHDKAVRADRAALRLNSPEAMGQSQNPLIREVAQAFGEGQIPMPRAEAASISVNQVLLDQSANMRDIFQRLLATTPAPSFNP